MVIILYPVLRYSDTPGVFHSPPFLGGYLLHSYDLNCHPLKSHPMLSYEPNILLVSQMYVKSTCPNFVTVFYLKWDFYISIQPVIQARKRESSFPLCFCTSHRLSSFLTPKSFINMLLPFLFLLWLLLLKFLPSFAWTATEELDRLASNYLLSQLFFILLLVAKYFFKKKLFFGYAAQLVGS